MSILINNIYYRAKKKSRLSILTFSASGEDMPYITMMAEAFPEHKFTCTTNQHNHWLYDIIECPDNLRMVYNDNFLQYNNFDLLICHEKIYNFNIYKKLSVSLQIPLIHYEHSIPHPSMRLEDIYLTNTTKRADAEVCMDSIQKNMWHKDFEYTVPLFIENTILPHNYQTQNSKILIVGDFTKDDYTALQYIIQRTQIPVEIIGNNPGLTRPPMSWENFIDAFITSTIFISFNTQFVNPIYTYYAMMTKCGILCMNSPLTNRIIEQSKCGINCSNLDELIHNISHITQDNANNGFQYILLNNNKNQYRAKWSAIFQRFANKVYRKK